MRIMSRVAVPLLALLPAALFTGCSLETTASSPSAEPAAITGHVFGGNSPVTGARIYVFEAGTTGYATHSIGDIAAASGTLDPVYGAYYTTTDVNGSFTLTGKYTCTAGNMVYVLATQGNPGLGAGGSNPALAEMAALGACPSAGTFASGLTIYINEVTTVGSVYAISGYMTAPNAVSRAATALSTTGLNNAFATVATLVNASTGLAQTTSTAFDGPGFTTPIETGVTPPTAQLNTLANILTTCVNSNGTGAGCTSLFAASTAGGVVPTDTVTAILNIAHNPSANVAALYALSTANPPFQPSDTSAPNDWTLAIGYTPFSSRPSTSPKINVYPTTIAIDAAGNVILGMSTAAGGTSCCFSATLNNQGTGLASSASNTTSVQGNGYAIDSLGNAWEAAFYPTSNLGKYAPATGTETHYTNTFNSPSSIAVDSSNNIYVTDTGNSAVYVLNSSGTLTSTIEPGYHWQGIALDSAANVYTVDAATPSLFINGTGFTGGGAYKPTAVALDGKGNAWVTNGSPTVGTNLLGPATLSKFSLSTSGGVTTATAVSPATGYSGSNVSQYIYSQRIPLAIDGASNVWVLGYYGVSEFSNSGSAINASAYGPGNARGMAIDGSGNVWIANYNSYGYTPTLYELVGAAVPVATPILPGQLGVRP